MNQIFGGNLTGFGCLMVIGLMIWLVEDDPYLGSIEEFDELDYFLFPIIMTILPIDGVKR